MRAGKLLFSIVLALFIAISYLLGPILAAPSQGLSLQISPLPIELSTKPGTSISTDLRVRNAGSQPEKLQVRLLKVSADNNGLVHLTQPGRTDDWAQWVSFSKTTFDAPTGEWQTIKMNIAVPQSAAFGYYFAVEYLRANEESTQPGQAVAHGAVATFILLNADSPGAKREAQIVSFISNRKSYEFLPASFTVKVQATGNVHVAPRGNIFITKGNRQIDSIEVNSAGGNILPQSSRFFNASWSDGFPAYQTKINANGQPILDKEGQAVESLHWDFSHANRLRFGHYTAHLVLVYDNGQRDVPMEASVSFWVIPWRLIGLLAVIIILPIFLYIRFRMERIKRKQTQKELEKLKGRLKKGQDE